MNNVLAMVIYATTFTNNHTMKTSPGASTLFRSYMFMDVPVIADLIAIQTSR